jgi:hypothetical protein
MLKFHWTRTVTDDVAPSTESLIERNPDLAIRSLLDDPGLQQFLSGAKPVTLAVAGTGPKTSPRLNQRRLLEKAAA